MPLESSYVLILRKAINGDKIPAKGFNYIWMFDIFKQKILLARLVIQLLLLFYALGTFTNILLTEGGHFFFGGGGCEQYWLLRDRTAYIILVCWIATTQCPILRLI